MGNQYILIVVAMVVTFVVGVAMAATGFSADSFMGLGLAAAGMIILVWMEKYRRNPVYIDASGQTRKVGPVMFVTCIALGALLLACGIYVGVYGIPQNAG